jgi:hypothetical protein
MKKLLFVLVAVSWMCTVTANAQEKATVKKELPAVGTAAPTPHWQANYQEESARDYIRRRAQAKTAARQARIEGMKWLGHSPARPVVSTTPFMSSVPSWVSVAPIGYWGPTYWPGRMHAHSAEWLP